MSRDSAPLPAPRAMCLVTLFAFVLPFLRACVADPLRIVCATHRVLTTRIHRLGQDPSGASRYPL